VYIAQFSFWSVGGGFFLFILNAQVFFVTRLPLWFLVLLFRPP